MFWIGLIVGMLIVILAYVIAVRWMLKNYFGLTYSELTDVTEVLEDVGHNRDSKITVTWNKDTEYETCDSIEFKKV